MENPNFLKAKYNLHNTDEVKSAARRTEERTGKKVAQNPEVQIQNYLDRLEKLALDPEKEQKRKQFEGESRPRALSLLREMIMNKYVRSNKEKLAQGAARVEERAAREMGIEAHYGEQELEQRGEIAVVDLEKSLDNWIAYLSDANEPYPIWFRYYAFRNVLNLGDYDKDKGEFAIRSQGSTRLFPDIDRGALAYVEQMIEAAKDSVMLGKLRKAQAAAANGNIPESELVTKAKASAFANLSFAKQYAEGIKQNGEITPEMREETKGKWIKYQQGTDPTALWASLQNKGTAWCTRGFATAETQLQGGDFYVYYTLDKQGNPTIPRVAIRMDGQNKISNDVRGVLDSQQNIEGNMIPIMEEKLKEFGSEADRFKKKSADMKKLTEIENKTKKQEALNKDDLVFLYEIDNSIDGFGYQRDPRIKEIRDARNTEQDAAIVFECEFGQIAKNADKVNENTKAYIGEWNMAVFQKIKNFSNIQHFYESFPDKKIFMQDMFTDPEMNSPEAAEKSLIEKNIYLSDWGKNIMQKAEFSQEKTEYHLVRFTVEQMGFKNGATTEEIYKKAEELGLELCPAEVGPHLRSQYPGKEWFLIAMEPIADSDGDPSVFYLDGHGAQLVLSGSGARSGRQWHDDAPFVFRFRKSDS